MHCTALPFRSAPIRRRTVLPNLHLNLNLFCFLPLTDGLSVCVRVCCAAVVGAATINTLQYRSSEGARISRSYSALAFFWRMGRPACTSVSRHSQITRGFARSLRKGVRATTNCEGKTSPVDEY
jgi:hypothetical protein